MKENSSKVKITTNDLHLKNIFLNDYYLEVGNIDVDVMIKILKYELVPVREIAYYPIQNKGLGAFQSENRRLRNEMPYMFFKKLNEKDKIKQLYLTYGLLECYKPNFKDRFMPVFLLPISLYYENDEFLLQLTGKPFENPLIYTIFGEQNRLNFLANKNLNDIYTLDQSLLLLNKISSFGVKLESYLTFATRKKRNVLENEKIFKFVKITDSNFESKVYGDENYYMQIPYTKQQRIFLQKAMTNENLTLSGREGTGKTTVLTDYTINAISKGKKILYISNNEDTIKKVYNHYEEIGLSNIVADFTTSINVLNKKLVEVSELETKEYSDKIEVLNGYYNDVADYEKVMTGRICDFLFKEIIEQLAVLVDIEHNTVDMLTEEDLEKVDYIHKNEFIVIKSALEKIQTNLYKVGSFKSSVWKEIPIFNTIKYANQIINLVNSLYKSYKVLYENNNKLETEYGMKTTDNFASFKKLVNIVGKVDKKAIPYKWQNSYEVFKKANDMFNDLKRDLYIYQENEYVLSSNYIDPFSINIKKEIETVLDDRFTLNDKDILDNIFMDSQELKSVIEQTLFDLKVFDEKKKNISKDIGWDYLKNDREINELIKFIDLINDNVITIRISNAVLNNKYKETINQINRILDDYQNTGDEITVMISSHPELKTENIKEAKRIIKEEPSKLRSFKRKYGKLSINEINSLLDRYVELNKTLKKLEEEYYVTTGFKMEDRTDAIEAFKVLNDYIEKIKGEPFLYAVKVFLDGYDSRLGNNKKDTIIKNLNSLKKSYYSLKESFKTFANYKLLDDSLSFTRKMGSINLVIDYLGGVFKSNNRVMSKMKNLDTYYVKMSDYLEFDSVIDKYNSSLAVLKNNKEYSNIYCELYNEENTNINNVSKIIQIFNDFGDLFKDSSYLSDGFRKLKLLKDFVLACEADLDDINETLKIYTRIFKDGVARYYYNDLKSIIDYLSVLSNSKDELVAYLNITNGFETLHGYGLDGLIDYISKIEGDENFVNSFQYIFFNRLKERYLSINKLKLSSKEFKELLNKIVDLEGEIRNAVNNNIIKNINDQAIKKSYSYEITKRNYQKYINKNTIKSLYLANSSILEEKINISKFDVVIIDDAELLSAVEYIGALKGKQIIIAGSFLIHKVFSNSLLSIYFDDKTTIFRERFVPTPKKLLDKVGKVYGIIKNNLHMNNGVEVINDNVEEYIYSLYNDNNNVKINYFIKDIEKQKLFIESLASCFIRNGVKGFEVLRFFDKNLSIVELLNGHPCQSDYNIIDLSEYLYLDSQIEATTAFDRLLLPREKLIICDKNNDINTMESSDRLLFYNNVKQMTYQKSDDELYNFEVLDENMAILISALKEKGYTVYPSSSGCDLMVARDEKFIGINILFSKYSFNEVLNYYRNTKHLYLSNDWNIIYINLMSFENGLTYIVNEIINQINKIEKKKGKK